MRLNFNAIGKKIKECRVSKRLSQEKLSEMCNLSTSFISCIESGKKKASIKSFEKIGHVLGIPIATLLNSNLNNDLLKYKSNLMLVLEDCNSHERKVIFDLVVALKSSLRNNN